MRSCRPCTCRPVRATTPWPLTVLALPLLRLAAWAGQGIEEEGEEA